MPTGERNQLPLAKFPHVRNCRANRGYVRVPGARGTEIALLPPVSCLPKVYLLATDEYHGFKHFEKHAFGAEGAHVVEQLRLSWRAAMFGVARRRHRDGDCLTWMLRDEELRKIFGTRDVLVQTRPCLAPPAKSCTGKCDRQHRPERHILRTAHQPSPNDVAIEWAGACDEEELRSAITGANLRLANNRFQLAPELPVELIEGGHRLAGSVDISRVTGLGPPDVVTMKAYLPEELREAAKSNPREFMMDHEFYVRWRGGRLEPIVRKRRM